MRSFLSGLALLGTLVTVRADGSGLRNEMLWKEKMAERFSQGSAISQAAVKPSKNDKFLTSKTKKFAVDGTTLPDVTFDLGETYAGLLPIDDASSRELFFWYVPTENKDAQDEILIWLNGGPGCSSLNGFFHENGPMTWMPGTFRPVKNTYAWNNLTNVVWIDQPVGTGYSQGKPNVTSEEDVAQQFNGFWRNFMDTFDLTGRKVYVAGESYAGLYVPYIADAMIKEQDKKYFDVQGILIYDPSIGPDEITEEVPTMAFVERNQQSFIFNDTFTDHLKKKSERCGYDDFMKTALTFPPEGHFPPPPRGSNCDIFSDVINGVFELNPCFDIYQVSQLCPLLWDTQGFPYSTFYLPQGYENPYFNHTDVKKALNVPVDSNWAICKNGVFPRGDKSKPSGANGGPLGRVAEATNNVIVGHGTLDMVLISEGSLMTLNNLTWNGKQGFSHPPSHDFYVPYHHDTHKSSWAGAGIYGRWVTERGMTFVEIDAAGHMVPEFQPSAGYRNLEFLLGRISNMSEISSFSTQPGFKQPVKSLDDLKA